MTSRAANWEPGVRIALGLDGSAASMVLVPPPQQPNPLAGEGRSGGWMVPRKDAAEAPLDRQR